ncbi:hypothetical protein HDU90_003445 [Geranomyces variabilis]|nr:hypothetical protein HDU90_003445 [Geranomyces variabilis]
MKVKNEDTQGQETCNEDPLVNKLKVTGVLGKAATATKQRNEKIAATTATIVSWAVEEIKKHIETQADLAHKYSITISQPDSGLDCDDRVRAELGCVLREAGWKVTYLLVRKEYGYTRAPDSTYVYVDLQWPCKMKQRVATEIQESKC